MECAKCDRQVNVEGAHSLQGCLPHRFSTAKRQETDASLEAEAKEPNSGCPSHVAMKHFMEGFGTIPDPLRPREQPAPGLIPGMHHFQGLLQICFLANI